MVELQLSLPALLRFLRGQGLDRLAMDDDLGYGIHAWLAAAFGDMAPGPWRLFQGRGRPPRILGYSSYEALQLQERMATFADPMAAAVCPVDGIASRPMPSWREGRRLGFEVQACPVGRKARSGIEKDIFLIRADHEQGPLDREAVYCQWLRDQLERDDALSVGGVRVAGFRMVRVTRRSQGGPGERKGRSLSRPQVLFRGELTIRDPVAFHSVIARGVGRHRAFGYGMILLRPAS